MRRSRSILGQSDGFLILGSWPTGALEGLAVGGPGQAALNVPAGSFQNGPLPLGEGGPTR